MLIKLTEGSIIRNCQIVMEEDDQIIADDKGEITGNIIENRDQGNIAIQFNTMFDGNTITGNTDSD